MPAEKLLVVATGTQGEPRAALARMAAGTHPIKLQAGDLVIFSSKQIPGNELKVAQVQNALAAMGVDVITEKQAPVHVSGHPGQPALRAIYDWIRPRIAVPVHGERRHLEAHARLALECGVERAMAAQNGMAIRLAPDGPEVASIEVSGRLVVDGSAILPADGETMVARRRMSWSGHLVVTLVVAADGELLAEPAVLASGLAIAEDALPPFQAEVAQAAQQAFADCKDIRNEERVKEAVRIVVRRIANQWTGKKPVAHIEIVEVAHLPGGM
jgi:ribonuclease J